MAADGNRQLRIGLVLEQPDVSRAGNPFQYGAFRGLIRARQRLHVSAKAVSPNPSTAGAHYLDPLPYYDYLAPLSYLARNGYDLVIALGGSETVGLSNAAHRFPTVKFALLDGPRNWVGKHSPPNVEGTVFYTEQAAYLAGFLAARIADRYPPPHVVSSVAGLADFLPVQRMVAGFQAGAKRADRKIKLMNTYTNDFVDKRKCRYAAREQIAHGSRVVFDVAGACGIGALEAVKHAANRKHVFGIGVDIDQSDLGRFILTSVITNLDVAVYDLAKRLVAGRVWGGDLRFDLHNRGVGLVGLGGPGKFSRDVPPGLRRKLRGLAAQIEHGKIVVPTTLSRSAS